MIFRPADHPHRRYDPLRDAWVLVAPHRGKRPWQGAVEAPDISAQPNHDPGCYLCPGNLRVNGLRNPDYPHTFVFANDHAALLPDGPATPSASNFFLRAETARGTSRVICYSPDHAKTLPELSLPAIERIVATWCDELTTLSKTYPWVQIFENKGAAMGCSSPHPHGQIWASSFLPQQPAIEDATQRAYFAAKGSPMLLDYAALEAEDGERIVLQSSHFVALVPYWASWPFETMLIPRQHVQRLSDLTADQKADLARVLKQLTTRYDNLFSCSFPYSMGWHGAPSGEAVGEHWQLHAHFYPPMLRSTVRKFMVGYEMLAEAQRDLTAEQAAGLLRATSETHYREP